MKIDFITYKLLKEIKKSTSYNIIGGIGVFDGVHLAHQHLIKKVVHSSRVFGMESAIITFYPPTRFLLGKNPYILTTILEKLELFEQFGIDRVIIFEFTEEFSKLSPLDFLGIIKGLGIRSLYVGKDFRFGKGRTGNVAFMKENLDRYKISVEALDILSFQDKKISSTYIKELILDGKIDKANRFLGYNFFVKGIVYTKREATSLITHINKVKPPDGIYKALMENKGEIYIYIKNNSIYLYRDYNLEGKTVKISFLEKVEKAVKNESLEFTDSKFYAKLY